MKTIQLRRIVRVNKYPKEGECSVQEEAFLYFPHSSVFLATPWMEHKSGYPNKVYVEIKLWKLIPLAFYYSFIQTPYWWIMKTLFYMGFLQPKDYATEVSWRCFTFKFWKSKYVRDRRENKKQRKFFELRRKNPQKTINERRKEAGLDPIGGK